MGLRRALPSEATVNKHLFPHFCLEDSSFCSLDLPTWSKSSFDSLSIFKTAVLKSPSRNADLRTFSDAFAVDVCYSLEGVILSCPFAWLWIFVAETGHLNLIVGWLWYLDSPFSQSLVGVFFLTLGCFCSGDQALVNAWSSLGSVLSRSSHGQR